MNVRILQHNSLKGPARLSFVYLNSTPMRKVLTLGYITLLFVAYSCEGHQRRVLARRLEGMSTPNLIPKVKFSAGCLELTNTVGRQSGIAQGPKDRTSFHGIRELRNETFPWDTTLFYLPTQHP